jgi:hypothetical protein
MAPHLVSETRTLIHDKGTNREPSRSARMHAAGPRKLLEEPAGVDDAITELRTNVSVNLTHAAASAARRRRSRRLAVVYNNSPSPLA